MTPVAYPCPEAPSGVQAVEVAEGILWMRLPLPMALDHVNVYALDEGDGWTLVDTGMDDAATRDLWSALMAGPLAGKPVRRLIVTHHHPDHIGLAGWFQAQGAELLTPRTAWLYARMLTLDEQPRPRAESLLFLQRAGLGSAALAARAAERPFNFCDVVAPMPLGFTRLAEGDRLRAGGREWRVRFGQGHAPDHATLWSLDDALILGGDQFLPTITPNIGVYATEPGADPLADWLASCAAFQPLAREDHLVLPGHKLPFTGLPGRLDHSITSHEAALARLVSHLAEPRPATDCFAPLFRKPVTEATFGLALAETLAHLNCLLARNSITRRLSDHGVWLWQASGD